MFLLVVSVLVILLMIVKDIQAMKMKWLNKTIIYKFCQTIYQCKRTKIISDTNRYQSMN